MAIDRREFLAGLGGSAMALRFPAPLAVAQGPAAAAPPRRKMIVRADDIGISDVCNIGTFHAIEDGVVTVAAVMLADPGTVDSLERLRKYPWLSVDWHMHMWGSPVSDAAAVPTLIEKSGPFAGRFREDLGSAADVSYDEALAELRAQLLRCERILGRMPDTGGLGHGNSPWARAIKTVNDQFGLVYDFSGNPATPPAYAEHVRTAQARGEKWAQFYSSKITPATEPAPQWRGRHITAAAGAYAYTDLLTDSVASVEANYDPVLFYTEDRAGILKQPIDVVTWQAWHPGYVDYTVYRLEERVNRARAQQFVIGRVQDVHALTDPRLKQWIRTNNIELVNFRDALYGTDEYQNHLKAIGSDLCMI